MKLKKNRRNVRQPLHQWHNYEHSLPSLLGERQCETYQKVQTHIVVKIDRDRYKIEEILYNKSKS